MTMLTPPPTLSPRRQRNHERMVQIILDTARQYMRENGVAALSMHELARRLEIRPPSLYNYFTGLMDIYDALFRLGFELWGEYFQDYTRGAQTWQDEVRLSMEAYLTFALQNPELYQLCFERPVPGFVPSEQSLQASFGILEEGYARIAGLKDALHTDLPPERVADLIIALMHGLTALHMANQPQLPLGQGRFGALIPAAVAVLDKAWSQPLTADR
jgi:AcrR family transcriptional regulator